MSRATNRRTANAAINQAQQSFKAPVSRPAIVTEAGDLPAVVDNGAPVYPQWECERAAVGAAVMVEYRKAGAFITGLFGGSRRLIGEAEQTQPQDVTTVEDMFDLHTTVQILAPGRRVRVTVKVYCETDATATGARLSVIDEDGDPVGDDGLADEKWVPSGGGSFMCFGAVSETPDVGDRTYQATLARRTAAGTVSALCDVTTARMWVEDMGPAIES